MPQKRSSTEERGLLQPEEFDIDELDYLETQNGHARKNSNDLSRPLRNRRARWSRSKCLCWSFAVVVLVLFAGAAMNKGGHFKIPKLPGRPASPEKTSPGEAPITPTSSMQEAGTTTSVPEEYSTKGVEDVYSSYVEPITTSTTALIEPTSSEDSVPTALPEASSFQTEFHHNGTSMSSWTKPTGFKIIGLIFYGRPDTVAILDCYLRKNLVRNGGWLDEVHFVMNTDKQDDIGWLDTIMEENKEYKKVEVDSGRQVDGYNAGWATCNKKDLYIKIDDDIVYFTEDAIPNLVFSLLHHPEALNVVATLVNSPETGWLHRRLGAIHAYLPEIGRTEADLMMSLDGYGPNAWRASALPTWSGKEQDMTFPVAGVNMGKGDGYITLPSEDPGAPPYKGHRWLPLPGGDKEIWRTPIAKSEYNPDGPDWASWSLGAQAHYSFLQNLENNTLHLYHMGSGLDPEREGLWDMAYERMNINFMAIWGKDVRENLPFNSFDDEKALSQEVTEKLRRPLLVNTHAIASHFHFRSQLEMYDTDLLSRYRAYANEKICTKDNQIPVS